MARGRGELPDVQQGSGTERQPFLQMEKLRLREVRGLTCGHSVCESWDWDQPDQASMCQCLQALRLDGREGNWLRLSPRQMWEAGRSRQEGKGEGQEQRPPLHAGRKRGRQKGPRGRRGASQEGLLPRRPQRSWW